jgi:lipoyl-dependent peroxiredoxin
MQHERKATAVWLGGGPDGNGRLTTGSGTLRDTPYSAALRFENADGTAGTNPEELVAAAHAGCFAMALSFQLSGAGHSPDELTADAVVTIEKEEKGWTVRSSALSLRGRVPGIDEAEFRRLAEAAKDGCPISRMLGVKVTLEKAELQR